MNASRTTRCRSPRAGGRRTARGRLRPGPDPAAALLRVGEVEVEPSRLPRAGRRRRARRPRRTAATVQRRLQRSAARTASPASSAAKLDCEKVVSKRRARAGRDQARAEQRDAPLPRPEQRGGDEHDRQRQVAAEDVRVPEERVDPEVGVELVGADHLVVPEQLADRVLGEADDGEEDRLGGDDRGGQPTAAAGPSGSRAASAKTSENGTRKKQTLRRVGEVVRVEGRERVEDDEERRACVAARRATAAPRAGLRSSGRDARDRGRRSPARRRARRR